MEDKDKKVNINHYADGTQRATQKGGVRRTEILSA